MARILSKERVIAYSREFKVKVVKLTELEGVQIKDLSACLGLHPFMVSRWRKEYRDGVLVDSPSRKIQMAVNTAPPRPKKELDEMDRLRRENERLKKENALLKKWRQYLKEARQSGSAS